MSYFKFVSPETTDNLFIDPQFGQADPDTPYDISFTGGSSPDVTRTTTDSFRGTGSALFDFDGGSACVIKDDITVTATAYYLSVWVKRSSGDVPTSSHVKAHFNTANVAFASITLIRDGWYLCEYTATATAGSRAFGIQALEDGLLLDSWQLENKSYRTTYCDGNQIGHRSDGYVWNGEAHNSTSTRHALERSGGQVLDFEDDLKVHKVQSAGGLGELNLSHNLTDLALLPGALYENSKEEVRYLDFGLMFLGTGATDAAALQDLHDNRDTFFTELSLKRVSPTQPTRFRYTGHSKTKEIDVYRQSPNFFSNPAKTVQTEPLRLVCPTPYFRALGDVAAALTTQADIDETSNLIVRDPDGNWFEPGGSSGVVGAVYDIAQMLDGRIVVAGNFTEAGGVSCNNIAIYDPVTDTFDDMASGLGTGGTHIVYKVAIAPDGKVYAVGTFTSPEAALAIYDPDTDTWDGIGTGLTGGSGYGRGIAFAGDGTFIVTGEFTDANTTTVANIAKGTHGSTTFSALGTGLNGAGNSVVIGLDGYPYILGGFTTANGVTVNRFTYWNGSTFVAIGSGLNNTGVRLALQASGLIYGVGLFTTANGITVNYIFGYDGNGFFALGSGLSAQGNAVYVNDRGLVRASINGVAPLIWTGSSFITSPPYETPPAGVNATSFLETASGYFYVGLGSANYSTVPGLTTITNNGSAEAYPTFIFTGPGQLYEIVNHTTGKAIYFNLTLLSSETVVLDITPTGVTFNSTFADGRPFRGNISKTILTGSDSSEFLLLPGDNNIGLFIDDATAVASIMFKELHERADS